MKKKYFYLCLFGFMFIPLSNFFAEGLYTNMYPGNYYNTSFPANGNYASGNLENIDSAGDTGVGDVYVQAYNDSQGGWIEQCSATDQYIPHNGRITCSTYEISSYYNDLRARAHYDYLNSGDFIYSHLW